ncbi:hypothetical protein CDD82_1815 [Ophiocordyceps australis]|uniref:Alpha-ketoglutarate-dependent dioxygenase AlkB-like domain-containing protein n=1 Tax=Ophiocordyceps australis TaxID=1399860 RepID=A0A2C5ZKI0_9HYPO|nr:hypothetical protein CDD82_1815 [Ophiocordyceps australis]
MAPSLQDYRIHGLPATAFYIADFITEQEERHLLGKVAAAPKPRWKQLTHRRLQAWPSDLVRNRLVEAPLPPWLRDPVMDRLLALPLSPDNSAHIFAHSPHQRPNHVLVNEYPPGDGAAYWPVVCTVSLGATICLDVHRSKPDGALDPIPIWRILQEPRSLLITTQDMYTDYLHGIADVGHDVDLSMEQGVVNWPLLGKPDAFACGRNVRQVRTSLTYRDVIAVSYLSNKIGLFAKQP